MTTDLMALDLLEQEDPRAHFWQETVVHWLNTLGSE